MMLNFDGLIIGFGALLWIVASRWLTIKMEYYFTKRFWIVFLLLGLLLLGLSLYIDNNIYSTLCGIGGCNFLWGIGEIIEQEERVNKGWFPRRVSRGTIKK